MTARLSTAIRIGDAAAAILHTARKLDEGGILEEKDWDEHIGVKPILLALSMELALKAWYAFDFDTPDVMKSHDLSKLFSDLSADSQEKLDKAFAAKVAPDHPSFQPTNLGIEDVLRSHANAFVEWRYLHELKGIMSFDESLFVATLELVIGEFRKRYRVEKASPPLRPF